MPDEVRECKEKGGHIISPMRWPLPAPPPNSTQAHVPYDAVRCLRRGENGRRCSVTVVLEYGRHAPERGLPAGVAQILVKPEAKQGREKVTA